MSHLKSYRLPSFTLTVRECTEEELSKQSERSQRDYVAVMIRAKTEDKPLTLIVGSPMIGDWSEDQAARAAISFASAPWCADDDEERNWMETHGEDLSNEAFCHGVLGKEMRQ